jgi:hypothetical protein
VIVFGAAMTDPEAYRRYAQPGIELAVEPDSAVYAIAAVGAIGRSANLLLDIAAAHDDLEALVLIQQDVEITDRAFCSKVRAALSDESVGVVGCAGATGVETIAWWEGAISAAPIVHRHNEHGGGELPELGWADVAPAPAEVETLDGMLLVLSPWAVRNVRFDEALVLGHGYDLDYCRRVRATGRSVWTADLRVTRHHPLELVDDLDLWAEAHIRVAEKWDPGDLTEAEWKQRARRAEAEREAARTIAYSTQSALHAELQPLEDELAELTETATWRATTPLRRANRLLGEWRGRKA